MKDYQKRLLTEKAELTEKLDKLKNFLNVDKIPLSAEQRKLLEKQSEIMGEYKDILEKRIELENTLEKERLKKEF